MALRQQRKYQEILFMIIMKVISSAQVLRAG